MTKLISLGIPAYIIRWIYSFLAERQQRVKIEDVFSEWVTLKGGMPQGTRLGPLTFVILIDGLRLDCLVHKFIDDTTASEILGRQQSSNMMNITRQLMDWTKSNNMIINSKKTKEIILGTLSKSPPPILMMDGASIERVTTFKLLGLNISSSFKWDNHVNEICSKTASRMHFLKILRRACTRQADALNFYITVIRPILDYACPVWHSMITKRLSSKIEAQQMRAMRIIYGDLGYEEALATAGIATLHDRREKLTREFFQSICQSSSCLFHLMPPRRDPEPRLRLRSAREYPLPFCRTKRFQTSFLPYSLKNFQ